MNKKQYNNVIDWTLKHEVQAQSEDSLEATRAICKNLGVALPGGTMKEVADTLATDDYMYWRSCTMQKAQEAADNGNAAIGVSEECIVFLAATDEEQPVADTAAVMTLDENTSAYSVAGLSYYSYGGGTYGSSNCVCVATTNLSVDEGWCGYNTPSGCATTGVYWMSNNTSVATVDAASGRIIARKAGVAMITARSCSNSCDCASFELWVRGKTPVILIHGRTDHSYNVWSVKSVIMPGDNSHYVPDENAVTKSCKLYASVDNQKITGFVGNSGGTEKPVNLGNKLKEAGYIENVNLFVFNYPNEDAVVHSAIKLGKYLTNLATEISVSGDNEAKVYFFSSRADCIAQNFKVNIVAHSMGGLVARYYIENMGCSEYINKLITICTPHWGSGYANLSNRTSINHKLCDHDLDFDSIMFGGNNPNKYRFDENACKLLDEEKMH